MEIKALKKSLHRFIDEVEDPQLLAAFYKIFVSSREKDWWNELDIEAKNLIQEGVNDFNTGKTYTNDEVMAEVNK